MAERKSVTCLAIGDPHIKTSNVVETEEMVEAIYRVVTEMKPDFVVVLGDMLDRHETIHVSPLTRAVKFLTTLEKLTSGSVFSLIGNHCMPNNRQFLSELHGFTALKHLQERRLSIIDKVFHFTHESGQKFVLLPYVPPGRFVEALDTNKEDWKTATCIFAHQEFFGAKMGAIVSEEGDKWDLANPYVVSGHIHTFQEPQANILYTGTPIQHAFGDSDHKTISYFEFFSPSERTHTRIDLKLRRKHLEHIATTEVATHVPRENCELKIVISGTSGEIKAIVQHPNIAAWKKAGHKIVYKDVPSDLSAVAKPATEQLSFSRALFDTMSDNPALQKLYRKIFGQVSSQTLQETAQTAQTAQQEPKPKLRLVVNRDE